jgi:hypothetical protein
VPNFGHRQPLGLDGSGTDFGLWRGLWQPQLRPAAELLGAQGGHIDEQETAFDRRGRLSRRTRLLDSGPTFLDFNVGHNHSV